MKTIPKRVNPPDNYVAWLNTPVEDPTAAPTWDNMPGPRKQELDQALLAEQGHICCYCGGRIGETEGDHHIEHLVPGRTQADPGALAYANLMSSCGPTGRPRRMQHCGEHKGDFALPVTPLQVDCADHFRYTDDGRILPSRRDPVRAEEAIRVLNLTERLLTLNRKGAIKALDDLDEAELRRFRQQCQQPREHRLNPYCFVLASVIDERLANRP